MKPKYALLAFFIHTATHAATASNSYPIECPAELPLRNEGIKAPEGWTAHAQSPLRLTSAEPMLGPPSSQTFLKPSETRTGKTGSGDTWSDLGGSAPEGKWIACRYGERGEVIIAKRLDDKTSACTVNYAQDGRSPPRVLCRR